MSAPITLTTDFGTRDSYVAQMKGVILGIHPEASLIDVTHEVPQGDVRQASWILEQIADAFPVNTIHVVVVDPGVGSNRQLVALESRGQRFLAPDNGILSEIVRQTSPMRAWRLDRESFWRKPTSTTFHGRDILAPTAAHWAHGRDPREFGTEIAPETLILLPACNAARNDEGWTSEIVAIDHFGNLLTSVRASDLGEACVDDCIVTIGDTQVRGIERFYASRAEGELIALFGSSGQLEVAVRNGSAAARLGLKVGAPVRVDVPRGPGDPLPRSKGRAQR